MSKFETLKQKNQHVKWIHVDDAEFSAFGRVLNFDTSNYIKAVEANIPIPQGVVYEASNEVLEALTEDKLNISNNVFGQMPIQIGYCAGHNSLLNAMEWHHGSEVNVMVTDAVLLLAGYNTIKNVDGKLIYDTKDTVAVYVPKGYAIECYSMVLHFAPISTDENGFFALVILPEKTNTDFTRENTDKYLAVVNKWILHHPDTGNTDDMVGENIKINY